MNVQYLDSVTAVVHERQMVKWERHNKVRFSMAIPLNVFKGTYFAVSPILSLGNPKAELLS